MANRIGRAMREIATIDSLANGNQWVNRIHPLVKFFITILYIVLVVSFGKYDLEGLIGMTLYPIIMFTITDFSVKNALYRMRVVLPLVCVVGIFNPIFDRNIIFTIGTLGISGGVVSMVTLMLKGILTVLASYLLVVSTSMEALCYALRKLHLPKTFVTQLLLIYRYIRVLMEEANRITQAYALRAPGQKGIAYHVWGPLLGQLLIRTLDRAQEIYDSMCLRGFDGEFRTAKTRMHFGIGDVIYLIVGTAGLILLFIFPVFTYIAGFVA